MWWPLLHKEGLKKLFFCQCKCDLFIDDERSIKLVIVFCTHTDNNELYGGQSSSSVVEYEFNF